MTNLEKMKEKSGPKTPFVVPENYFEQFSEKMMAQLPEKEVKPAPVITLWKRVKPIIYLAAMFTAAIWGVSLFVTKKGATVVPVHAAVNATEHDAESVSLAMSVDDYSLYEYLNNDAEN